MRVTRCYVDALLPPGTTVKLPDSVATHLVRVLRLKEADACVLFNGDGNDYSGRIVAAGKREVLVEITSVAAVSSESPLRICLLQGIARGEKMDLILQKATELGISCIMPVFAERTEVKLDAERTEKRMGHWRSVIVSACEQSGRARVPLLSRPESLAIAAAAIPQDELRITLDPVGELSLSRLTAPSSQKMTIAIGPEGGWSARDRETLRAAGFSGVRLGPRILRTETAGLAAIAVLQSRFGDFCWHQTHI